MISKLPSVGTTIFTVMSQLAVEHNAINLGQGFPDFMMSEDLVQLVCNSMRLGNNQYVHMNGLPILREGLAQKVEKLYGCSVNPEKEITVTPGGTYAIYTALTAILYPGDEVIVIEPAYDSYIPNIEINGAKAILVSMEYPGYTIPWQQVKNRISSKTKAIILNSPHNPTGSVLEENDIAELRSIISNTNIYIISDEVYEHLIFDDKSHLSMLRYPDLFERSFVCFSFGKTYHCTGWKLGYCMAPPSLMAEFRKVHQFNCFSCNSAPQYAFAEYLKNEAAYNSLGKFMQYKRDYLNKLMQQTAFTAIPSYGSYFQCYSYQGLSNKNEKEFAVQLVNECGVATIPMSSFYKYQNDNKVLRFCFAKKEETLDRAVEKLLKFKP